MQLKKTLLAALFCLLPLVSLPSLADTLSLVSSGGETVKNEYIYPYNFSVNGSTTLTSLICLDLNRTITVGQSWNVYITGLPLDSSATSVAYRTDAWILGQLGKSAGNGTSYSDADVQLAVWDIFDPSDTSALGLTANAQKLVTSGGGAANNTSLLSSGYFSQFTLYMPTDNTASDYATGSVPQRFIGDPGLGSAVAPEPSSLMLLGTGLLGVGSRVLRRKTTLA